MAKFEIVKRGVVEQKKKEAKKALRRGYKSSPDTSRYCWLNKARAELKKKKEGADDQPQKAHIIYIPMGNKR